MAQLATPNIPEGQILADMEIRSEQDMEKAAAVIYDRYGCAVLLKGGHSVNDANDLLYDEKGPRWFRGKRIDNPNTHGTGCTFSSAIAANLAKGFSLDDSVIRAKDYISGALSAMLDLGSGSGPMDHAFDLDSGSQRNRELSQKPIPQISQSSGRREYPPCRTIIPLKGNIYEKFHHTDVRRQSRHHHRGNESCCG